MEKNEEVRPPVVVYYDKFPKWLRMKYYEIVA